MTEALGTPPGGWNLRRGSRGERGAMRRPVEERLGASQEAPGRGAAESAERRAGLRAGLAARLEASPPVGASRVPAGVSRP